MKSVSIVGADVILTVASVAGETHQLQYATDLLADDWTNVPGAAVTNAIGGAPFPGRYFRLVITP